MPASINPSPYEIIAAPFTIWLAAVGTAFPDTDTTPPVAWTKVGTSGDLNYMEDGITVEHSQTIERFRGLGSGGVRKVWRTEESLVIKLVLADVSLEMYSLAMAHNTITTTPSVVGTPGTKKMGLSRNLSVPQRALLMRGPSPYADNMYMQYEVPVAIHVGNPSLVYRKSEPVGLAMEWEAMIDPNAAEAERFGRLVAQNEDADT